MKLSWMLLFLIKAVWFFEIILSSTGANLLASSLGDNFCKAMCKAYRSVV
jgi:hypothetical protein